MCGRFSLTDPERLERAFGDRFVFPRFSADVFKPRFNIAPTQSVIGVANDDARKVEIFRWGIGDRINARVETIASRPPTARCVIFTDGFYEWKARQPVHFRLVGDEPFAFAGILATSTHGLAAAIVTCPPNELTSTVHNRMPAILDNSAMDVWLSRGAISSNALMTVLTPYPAQHMYSRSVSSRLNSARYDASDVLNDDDPKQEALLF